ncbi:Ddi1p [Sporobolomyces koalae]|uniref:Ddi1p n=1 Tax=Sporobolomyces koalae TaxID=500713 RepID=UPI00316B8DD2
MLLTVATEDGNTFNLDLDGSMEVETLAALLEADSGIPTGEQLLFFSGRQLTNPSDSLESYGIKSGDMLLLRQKSTASSSTPRSQPPVAGRNVDEDSETMRRQLLGNPQLMAQLRSNNPELAAAAENDPAKFRQFLHQMASMQESARLQQQHETSLLNADPFNIEAQRKIEEAIRQEAVLENMEQAMEQMPESFGQVHMLYVNTEVNGVPVKAFVDSGAQSTIMSPECAERCGIMRLIDKRFAGMARGVGTAKILGRVHSAQLKMGTDLFLQCSFTILEGKDVDLLFGLDMLKRHQANIDLAQDALVIQGRKIPFLAEHELPKGQFAEIKTDENGNLVTDEIPSVTPAASSSSKKPSASTSTPFPGSGNTLGSTGSSTTPSTLTESESERPVAKRSRSNEPNAGSSSTERYPAESIQALIGLGVGRDEAIKLLNSTGGNVELAASLLFSQ